MPQQLPLPFRRRDRYRYPTASTSTSTTATLVALLLVATGAAGSLAGCSQSDDTTVSVVADPRPTDTVRSQDLLITHRVDGRVAAAEVLDVSAAQGEPHDVLTPGTLAASGDVLFQVAAEPVVLLDGALPAWRTLRQGTSGPDVAQLETALVALGYDPDSNVMVDEDFTSTTAALVRAWQEDVGLPETGRVELGQLVFASTPRMVEPAAPNASSLLALATPSRLVQWSEPLAEAGRLAVGDRVSVRLPDRRTVDATVTRLTTDGDQRVATATPASDQATTEAMERFDTFEVDVSWPELAAENALTVPTGSITRLEGGVDTIEIVEDDGSTRFVPVEVGPASQGRVVIVGDVPVGTTVIAP